MKKTIAIGMVLTALILFVNAQQNCTQSPHCDALYGYDAWCIEGVCNYTAKDFEIEVQTVGNPQIPAGSGEEDSDIPYTGIGAGLVIGGTAVALYKKKKNG